jgi:hypothetical protein
MIGDAEELIDDALAKFGGDVKKAEADLYDLIIRYVFTLESARGGDLSRGRDNRRAALAFDTELEKFLLQTNYNDVVKNLLANFDELEKLNKEIHKDLNDITLKNDFLNPYKEWATRKVSRELNSIDALAGALVNPIQDAIFTTVQRGGSLSDLVDEIGGLMGTTADTRGILERYATQVTRDTFNGYEGAVNNAVKEAYNLNAIKYVGSLVKDSRPQCIRWVNKTVNGESAVILIEELPQEIDWAYTNGSGMHPGTTPDNFLQHRGGYNCRHSGYPFRI